MVTKTCEICGQQFTIKPYRQNKARFCSRRCGGVWHCKTRLRLGVSERMKGNKYGAGRRPANAFKKGHSPWNAGLRGIHVSPSSEFKKGCKSNRILPVGTTTIRTDKARKRRAYVKIADPSTWVQRATLVWESINGKLPSGCVIHHIDRDTLNDHPDNLRCLTRRQHLEEHRAEHRR